MAGVVVPADPPSAAGSVGVVSLSGVVYAHQTRVPIRVCIEELELIATAGEPDDFRDQVLYLPL